MTRKILRNRFNILLAEKAYREGRKSIPEREITEATGLAPSTVNRVANNVITMYDNRVIIALCEYFNCTPGDLLVLEEIEESSEEQSSLQAV